MTGVRYREKDSPPPQSTPLGKGKVRRSYISVSVVSTRESSSAQVAVTVSAPPSHHMPRYCSQVKQVASARMGMAVAGSAARMLHRPMRKRVGLRRIEIKRGRGRGLAVFLCFTVCRSALLYGISRHLRCHVRTTTTATTASLSL